MTTLPQLGGSKARHFGLSNSTASHEFKAGVKVAYTY